MYDLELRGDDLLAPLEFMDLHLTVRSETAKELPPPDAFSAWLLKTCDHRTPCLGGWPPATTAEVVELGESPDSTRLLVSGSTSTGDYLVEGIPSAADGAWILLVEVATECGKDLVAYMLQRS